MFLKKVSISGFKSFPDPIELGFREGVTAIVGPNGCGKTNIADAIRWALGEQRVKSLRGRQMTDVIFSGSEARKPVGMAEVALLLSNEDQALPLEYTDILISRRLFRSGESAYLLNRNPCRLKEIHDLLLDTGIGINTYAIIEQAQVDQILSKEPLERRELFDEAAGIGRYKKSRAEALKKLAETDEGLLRLADRLEELEAQLRSLRREVKKAERHRLAGEELARLEAWISLHHWRTHQVAVEELEGSIAGAEDDRIAVSAELSTLDAEITRIREAQLAVQNELGEAENRRYSSLTRVKDFENRLSVSQERQAGRQRRRVQIEAESARLNEEREGTQTRLTEAEREKKKLEDRLESVNASIESRREALEALTTSCEDAEKGVSRLGSRLIELAALSSGGERVKIERLARTDALEGELESLASSVETDRRSKGEHEGRLKKAASKVEKLEGRLAALEERCAETIELQRKVNGELVEASEETRRALERLNHVRAELESQEKIHVRHEGYQRGVTAVLASADKGALSGIVGTLAQLVRTEERYEAAVEAALGASAQAVVCRTEGDVRRAVDLLNRLRAGRVRFLPLDLIRARQPVRRAAEINAAGLVGDALDLVTFDDGVAAAVEFALGGTLVAESLGEAVTILREWRDRVAFRRIVTLQGEVVESGGVIVGGMREGLAEGLLSRVRELDRLRENLREAEEAYRVVHQSEDELRRRFSATDQSLVAQREQSTETRLELERERLEVERLTAELSRLEETIKRSLARTAEIQTELAGLEPLPEGAEANPEEEAALWEEHSAALAESERLSAERDSARNALEEERLARGKQESRLEVLTGEIERCGRDLAALDAQTASLREELSELDRESEEADADLEKLTSAVSELTLGSDDEERRFQDIHRRMGEIGTELGDKMGARGTVASRAAEIEKKLSGLRESLIRERAEQDRLVIEAREHTGHDITGMELGEDFDLALTHRQVERLRHHRESLGEINYAAVSSYDAACERRDFYRSRRDELERGAVSLGESIRHLNAEASERFLVTFNQVVVNFERLFRNLFSGGEARLTLTGGDPLEGGIEVDVRPPGKGSQPLIGRSGGERALTAIALLFALFEVKPSPFCILDEIDAPLDDANVDRYLKLLAIFAQKSQFLVITHNRRTMEAADTLVGVTMVEAGVSRLYTLAFSGGRLVTEEDQRSFSLKRKNLGGGPRKG
ncbi:MAG TPA: chromosome segregation protein SMC [bacterium]|nr:chromosome segregation protein SMC [bacterium]